MVVNRGDRILNVVAKVCPYAGAYLVAAGTTVAPPTPVRLA
jgi:hypothetical protein